MMDVNLPKKVGESIEIPVCNPAERRELEGRGFFITKVTSRHYTIHRDCPDGVLKTH